VRVFSFAGVDLLTLMMRRAIHTFGPAAALVFAALVVLALFLIGQGLSPIHGTVGCNRIPLVNGQPAYRCANIPPAGP